MSSDAPFIPLCVPHLAGNEAANLARCVDTNWVSSAGPFVDRFERQLAGAVGLPHAVATASGTAALHVALMVAGVEPGDLVLVPSLTFIATANAVRHAGAEPLFVDADPATWQMDPALVAAFLADACDGNVERATGRRVGAVLPVDLLGHPADMDPIVAAARAAGVAVVEDATESLGALYKGRPAGALGDIAAFSFNGNKLVTCGGGGMIVTPRTDWAHLARHLTTQAKVDEVESIHDRVGYNYRLTNLQAAVGCAQMDRLADLITAKLRIRAHYEKDLADLPGLAFMPDMPGTNPVPWLTTITLDPTAALDRHDLAARLAEAGIQTRPLWQPLHRSPAHAGARVLGGAVAEGLQARALSLPSSCGLEPVDQGRVIAAMRAALR